MCLPHNGGGGKPRVPAGVVRARAADRKTDPPNLLVAFRLGGASGAVAWAGMSPLAGRIFKERRARLRAGQRGRATPQNT